jgi:hypothetical protein
MSQTASRRFLNTVRLLQEQSRRLREAFDATEATQLARSEQLIELSKKATEAVESVRRDKTTS